MSTSKTNTTNSVHARRSSIIIKLYPGRYDAKIPLVSVYIQL